MDIKSLRQSVGITQQDLAQLLGVSLKTMHNYEKGHTKVPDSIQRHIKQIVSSQNTKTEFEPNILHVPAPAEAGFLGGMVDPITNMELFPYYIPGFRGQGYSFEVKGDSMLATLSDGNFVITDRTPLPKLSRIINDFIYVIVSQDEILVKRVNKHSDEDKIWLISDNEDYDEIEYPVDPLRTKIYQGRRIINWNLSKKMRYD